jgi:hypothetical protein
MKRAALSPNALRLPPSGAPVTLEIVRGRQAVVRRGIFFAVIGNFRRSVYMQLDGSTILADECKCMVEWLDDPRDGGYALPVGFEILRNADCPIDEHQILAHHDLVLHAEDDE